MRNRLRELGSKDAILAPSRFSPEVIKLGYGFSVAMQEKDNQKALEFIAQIEQLPTIWGSEQ